jgi:hypothetical protein
MDIVSSLEALLYSLGLAPCDYHILSECREDVTWLLMFKSERERERDNVYLP